MARGTVEWVNEEKGYGFVAVYAAESPARDLVSGGAARALILNQRLSPRMLDAVLATRAGSSPRGWRASNLTA